MKRTLKQYTNDMAQAVSLLNKSRVSHLKSGQTSKFTLDYNIQLIVDVSLEFNVCINRLKLISGLHD